ncbi:uncharacterized protein METZ01_LOCUS517689 [marine metagenome]|uniref:Uncharacterized protein n=1 Tax=marine metagenome TaxID=408172 RepID=A0A383F8V3_9ZZZZ
MELPEGKGIHENNPKIHLLSLKLNRLPRSIEAQLHMFKSIQKKGDHAWGHMSKNCRAVWKEYLDSI